jgi:hypothetical protein
MAAAQQALEGLVAKCLYHGNYDSTTALTEAGLRQVQERGGDQKSNTKKEEEEVCKALQEEALQFANKNALDSDTQKKDVFLAQLLSKLSVIFDNKDDNISSAAIARALHLVKGILDGAWPNNSHNQVVSSASSSSAAAGVTTVTSDVKALLGRFLVPFCGHGKEEENISKSNGDNNISEEASTRVRAIALDCLASLLNWRSLSEMPSLSLTLAHNGVESYLGIREAKDNQQGQEDMDSSAYGARVSSHMASLVRIQRSKCISLLQTAVDQFSGGVSSSQHADPTVSSPKALLHQYALLCASCLQGETDPRCIKQLMTLIYSTQTTFCSEAVHRWLQNNHNNSGAGNSNTGFEFPTVAVFDAVAPYYPIRFTPPPNDPYGIRRSELREALSLVLCHPSRRLEEDGNGLLVEEEEEDEKVITMTCLACEIFLEQLEVIPQGEGEAEDEDEDEYGDGDDSNTNTPESIRQDYLEACEDLTRLLFFTPVTANDGAAKSAATSMLFHLPPKTMTNVSDALVDLFIKQMYHHTTAQHVERQLGPADSDETVDDEEVSSSKSKGSPDSMACLELASRLAQELEVGGPTYKIREELWEAFHATIKLHNLARTVTSTSEGINAKIGIVYLCRLAQCGLKARAKWVVDVCMPPLVDKVLQYKQDRRQYRIEQDAQSSDPEAVAKENDRVQAALLALSACLTAYSTPLDSQTTGSRATPHPSFDLVTRLKDLFDALIELGCLSLSRNEADGSRCGLNLYAVSPAAINALECLLCGATQDILDADTVSSAQRSLLKICCDTDDVISTNEKSAAGNDTTTLLRAWQASCAHALGSVLGVLAEQKKTVTNAKEGDSPLRIAGDYMLETFLDEVLAYVTTNRSDTRAALSAMARACVSNESVADLVFAKLISNLVRSDKAGMLITSPQASIQSLAYILSYGGNFATNAWVKVVDSNNAVVIKELMELLLSQRTARNGPEFAADEVCYFF